MWIHTGGYRWLRGKLVNNKCILTPLNLAGNDVNAKTLFKASIHVLLEVALTKLLSNNNSTNEIGKVFVFLLIAFGVLFRNLFH